MNKEQYTTYLKIATSFTKDTDKAKELINEAWIRCKIKDNTNPAYFVGIMKNVFKDNLTDNTIQYKNYKDIVLNFYVRNSPTRLMVESNDFLKCYEYLNDKQKQVVKSVYENINTPHRVLAPKLGMNRKTFSNYLQQAKSIFNEFYFNNKLKKRSSIYCITNGITYTNMQEAGKSLNIDPELVRLSIIRGRKYKGYRFTKSV